LPLPENKRALLLSNNSGTGAALIADDAGFEYLIQIQRGFLSLILGELYDFAWSLVVAITKCLNLPSVVVRWQVYDYGTV
jgi:hypothetical protein